MEINLPDCLEQLLNAADPSAAFASHPAACGHHGAKEGGAAHTELLRALWPRLQLAVMGACECLSLLSSMALHACARSEEPLAFLLQVAGEPLMAACTRHLAALRRASSGEGDAGSAVEAARAAVHMVASLAAPYGVIAMVLATDGKEAADLRELSEQLSRSCCNSGFLAAACGALLVSAEPLAAADRGADALVGPAALAVEDRPAEAVARSCEMAAESLLSLALFLSSAPGDPSADVVPGEPSHRGIERIGSATEQWASATLPAGGCCADSWAGAAQEPADCGAPANCVLGAANQPLTGAELDLLPLSLGCGARVEDGWDSPIGNGGRAPAARGGACAAPSAALAALAAPDVLAFLEERLHRSLLETNRSACESALAACGRAAPSTPLPGCAAPGPDGPRGAALCLLRCWRALLRGGRRDARIALADPRGRTPALLSAAMAVFASQAGGRTSTWSWSPTEEANMRCMVAAEECLIDAVAVTRSCPAGGGDALRRLLPAVCGASASAAATVAGAWDCQRRGARSRGAELPYSGQLKCLDRGTAGMLEHYCRAAHLSVDALRAMLDSLSAGAGRCGDAGAPPAALLVVEASILPALEGIFRRVPPVSPLHVAATELLAVLLPAYVSHLRAARPSDGDSSGGAAMVPAATCLLTTLRKFSANCAGAGGGCPAAADAEPAAALGVQLVALLRSLLADAAVAHECGNKGDELLTFAAAQLVPAAQVLALQSLKTPAGPRLAGELSSALSAAASLHGRAPHLGLLPVLLAHDSLGFLASAAAAAHGAGAGTAGAPPGLAAAALSVAEAVAGVADGALAWNGGAGGCDKDARPAALLALLRGRLLPELHRLLGQMAEDREAGEEQLFFGDRDASAPLCNSLSSLQMFSSTTSLCSMATTDSAFVGSFTYPMAPSSPSAGASLLTSALSSPSDDTAASCAAAAAAAGFEPPRLAPPLREFGGSCGGTSPGALAARLRHLLLRLAAAALAACGPQVPAGPATETRQTGAGAADALAVLGAALAAAGGAALPLLLRHASSGVSCCGTGGSFASPSPGALILRPTPFATDPCGAHLAVLEGASMAASGATGSATAFPNDKLLRALSSAAPAVAKAALPPSHSSCTPLSPEALPRAVPALASLRVGCWSAACASLAGASEASAPLKPCADGCGAAVFCSRQCVAAAFAAHAPECREMAAARAASAGAAGPGSGGCGSGVGKFAGRHKLSGRRY